MQTLRDPPLTREPGLRDPVGAALCSGHLLGVAALQLEGVGVGDGVGSAREVVLFSGVGRCSARAALCSGHLLRVAGLQLGVGVGRGPGGRGRLGEIRERHPHTSAHASAPAPLPAPAQRPPHPTKRQATPQPRSSLLPEAPRPCQARAPSNPSDKDARTTPGGARTQPLQPPPARSAPAPAREGPPRCQRWPGPAAAPRRTRRTGRQGPARGRRRRCSPACKVVSAGGGLGRRGLGWVRAAARAGPALGRRAGRAASRGCGPSAAAPLSRRACREGAACLQRAPNPPGCWPTRQQTRI